MISILILTRNEEKNLPGCLESVGWSDDIVVYDSLSTDQTQHIARLAGARVIERAFDNWSAHQNWGLEHIPFRHPWVFYIDADERLTPEAAVELQEIARQAHRSEVAYRIRRRDYFNGRWLRYVQTTTWYIRFFRPEAIRYERLVNPVTIVNGLTGNLAGALDHFPFSKGIDQWIARHNDYSLKEAQTILINRRNHVRFCLCSAFLASDRTVRRYHQKELFYRMPARPLLKFFLLYLLKGGFRDGAPGFTYACLQVMYEYMIVIKVRELEILALH